MNFKVIFKTYYLPLLVSMSILFGIICLPNYFIKDDANSIELVLIFLTATLTTTLLLGGMTHLLYELYRPKRIKKVIRRPSLSYLKDLGFHFDEKQSLYYGVYRTYFINIIAEWKINSGDSIDIEVLFEKKEKQRELIMSLLKKYDLNIKEGNYWLVDSIGFYFNSPRKNKLEKKLNELIDIMIENHVLPEKINSKE